MDTHEVDKELLAAGFTEGQAEAVTRLVYKVQEINLSNLATKADLTTTKAELLVKLAETKSEILKWMIGTIGVQTVVILGTMVTLIRLLPR
nr:hypothetical protein [uncultured Rhodopila sp.]